MAAARNRPLPGSTAPVRELRATRFFQKSPIATHVAREYSRARQMMKDNREELESNLVFSRFPARTRLVKRDAFYFFVRFTAQKKRIALYRLMRGFH